MKKTILFCTLLFVLSFVLGGCGDGLVSLKYTDGKFVNGAKGLSYLPAPVSYEPTSVGDAYAYYKKGDVTMYRIGDNDPALWLTEEYADGATTVFYSDAIDLPILSEMNADTVYVCLSDYVTVAVCTIDDAARVADLVNLFETGAAAEWPLDEADTLYQMKFASPDWPQIYINLLYGEFGGETYLYDRNTRRCVAIGDVLADLLPGDEA